MSQLSPDERRELRARAHSLNPVVAIAENGLSEAVLKEIDINLKAHGLIKIRVFSDIREDREAYLEKICSELDASAVQHIGKLLIIYRPDSVAETAANNAKSGQARRPANTPRRTKRSFQG